MYCLQPAEARDGDLGAVSSLHCSTDSLVSAAQLEILAVRAEAGVRPGTVERDQFEELAPAGDGSAVMR